ncbi:TPA: hypothetical protein EYN98_11480 [Candidatus Poribacteria bacterium]|jgi:hypothetical protein|nr:hypothetical protein [Candidatus Poribacteria bacterium]HIA66657.1 hypothetical protein [Candidatus Poribacteria bacterium]HIN31540.1 hypothetical protein [Candidatus Poribacteria bacterium]
MSERLNDGQVIDGKEEGYWITMPMVIREVQVLTKLVRKRDFGFSTSRMEIGKVKLPLKMA